MNRYVLYRCPEKCGCHSRLKEHELVGAVVAESIEEALEELYEEARIDMQAIQPEGFQEGPVDFDYFYEEEHSRKYQYSFEIRLFPENDMAPKNPWREYAIQVLPLEEE